MGVPLSKLCTDKVKAREGVWMDLDGKVVVKPDLDRIELKIASLGTAEYTNARAKALLACRMVSDELTQAQADEIQISLLHEFALRGWRHIDDDEGNELKYSPAAGLLLMKEERKFYKAVENLAFLDEPFEAADVGALVKNLRRASNGVSATAEVEA